MVILLFQQKTHSILHAVEDGNDVVLNDLQCLLDMFHPAIQLVWENTFEFGSEKTRFME